MSPRPLTSAPTGAYLLQQRLLGQLAQRAWLRRASSVPARGSRLAFRHGGRNRPSGRVDGAPWTSSLRW